MNNTFSRRQFLKAASAGAALSGMSARDAVLRALQTASQLSSGEHRFAANHFRPGQ